MFEHVRIGIVDIGSNAIRFLIAETNGRDYRTVESHRLAVRLGQNVFQTGLIDEPAIAATADAFRKFRKSCDQNGVLRTRAIATAAMRSAKNGHDLIERVRDASQFEIDVISGAQEAQLLKLGIETKIDLSRGKSLLVDVGGGSV
ncbi:MAG: exopolyphosphatase/guanosine-5'-triphosphate,3'-diphosphate pyrophosphatase, partial [Planctomycetota bacterium]